ncbi:MAG: hypothetical protein KGI83_04910, partial [Verrucomicrobiota bacterium]|nr:hypothetical protein [Verrucomicrobiota bacterium]
MEVTLDTDLDAVNNDSELQKFVSDTVKLCEREDQEVIRKVQQCANYVSENYISRMYAIMPQILADQHRSGEKSKNEIHRLEKMITKASLNAADLQKDLGWQGLITAGVVMTVSLLQFAPGTDNVDQQFANLLAKEIAPNVMGVFRSGIESNLSKENNKIT